MRLLVVGSAIGIPAYADENAGGDKHYTAAKARMAQILDLQSCSVKAPCIAMQLSEA